MKRDSIHIVFAGGGTGGHLFPGLAVAERLATMVPGVRITFCGGGKPLERQSVAEAGFEYFALPARPLPHRAREAVSFVLENLAGYMAAKWYLREQRVAAVVGLGGYASVPMARAAAVRRLPLVLLEQNLTAGKATRWLASRASLVCVSFAETQQRLGCRCPVRVTGNPVRSGFCQGREGGPRPSPTISCPSSHISPPSSATLTLTLSGHRPQVGRERGHGGLAFSQRERGRHLLVLGGSGGARSLNENVPLTLHKVRSQLGHWRIVHQAGESGLEATRTLYRKLALNATVVPFLTDMPKTLAATDLAICRAGGTTLAELAASGVPAVLLPYPQATDDHQAANGGHYASGGGCVTIDERKLSGRLSDELAEMLCFLLANDGLRGHMSAAMLQMARPHAAEDVAELVWSLVSSRSRRVGLANA